MKYLVTGAGGFIGSYLVEALLEQGREVIAYTHRPSPLLDAMGGKLRVEVVDLLDEGAVTREVIKADPDIIVHLVGQSLMGPSWEDPGQTFRVNVFGTTNLLNAIRERANPPRVLVASSSSIYAMPDDHRPISEDDPWGPLSPYGVSKAAQDDTARLLGTHYELPIIRFRPFFLIGPRKQGDVSSDFARGIVAIERGERADLPVGNLEPVRDFMDVRDGVAAICLLAEKGTPGEAYNVCSGEGYSVSDLLGGLKDRSTTLVQVRVDPDRVRPVDEPVKIGNPSRLTALGWRRKIEWEHTLSQLLAYWRDRE